jgi:hypothetical protein
LKNKSLFVGGPTAAAAPGVKPPRRFQQTPKQSRRGSKINRLNADLRRFYYFVVSRNERRRTTRRTVFDVLERYQTSRFPEFWERLFVDARPPSSFADGSPRFARERLL